MGLIRAILKHGISELNLNDPNGNYHLARDFVPPPVSLSSNLAHGTSANRLGGAELVSTKAVNRNWTFSIHVSGTSEAEIRNAVSVLDSFIRRGSASEPVFVHVRGSEDVGFEPLWGQFGSDLRYEIVFGRATLSRSYSFGFVRQEELPECGVNLDIKPFAVGLQQRVGSAHGGILEDTIGTVDGISRGTIIPEDTINKMTNPIFGHATYDNGWTATSLTAAENTDEKFITHGKSSAKLTDPSGGGQFTQSINVGNTNPHELSCYAKLPDGGAISSTQAELYYNGSTETTTFTLEGDGIYRLTASVTGVASGVTAGIEIKAGYTVYTDGFQIDEKDYPTPMAHGDMLGCSWTGTAHDSTSSRIDGLFGVAIDNVLDVAEGTIRIAIKMAHPNTHPNDMFFLDTVTFLMRFYFKASDDKFYFEDDTNTISSTAQTFSVGDILILHATYGPGSLKIYKNGTQIATGGTYTPPALTTTAYIGSTSGSGLQVGGTFMDFTTFAQAMTATEVSDDYTNILEQVEDNRRLSPVPWDWTKDGDSVLDNVDDDDRDNYHIASGIPGSAPAITRFKLTASTNRSGHTIAKTAVDQNDFRVPNVDGLSSGYQYYFDLGQTDDAAASDGKTDTTTVGTSDLPLDSSYSSQLVEPMQGEVHFFARIREPVATGNLQVRPFYAYDNTANARINGAWVAIDVDTTYKHFYLGSLNVRAKTILDPAERNLYFGLRAIRTSGSAAVYLDYFLLVPGEVMILKQPHAEEVPTFWTENGDVMTKVSSLEYIGAYTGEKIELTPEKYNIVWHAVSDQNDDSLLTSTTTINELYVTPRWALL